MFNNEIQAIISQLETNIPQFNGNGNYIEKGKESFKFTDNIPFWFFIDWPEGENFDIDFENTTGYTSYHATGSLRLVARFTGVNICDAVEVMIGNLLSVGLKVNIQSASIDETTIMQDVFEKEPKDNIQLVRILFTIQKYSSLNCTGLICDDYTC